MESQPAHTYGTLLQGGSNPGGMFRDDRIVLFRPCGWRGFQLCWLQWAQRTVVPAEVAQHGVALA